MEKSAVSPKSVKLPREPCAAGFREGVSNVELHLGWDQVLVGQKLQFPHPTSLHQLESDVLRVGAQPAEYLIHIALSYSFLGKQPSFKKGFLLLLQLRKMERCHE